MDLADEAAGTDVNLIVQATDGHVEDELTEELRATLATPMKRADRDDFNGYFGDFRVNRPGDKSCFPDGHALGGRSFPLERPGALRRTFTA